MSSDSFTNSDGTTLPSHDANWADQDAAYAAADLTIQSNRARPPTWGNGAGAGYSNGQPADQDSYALFPYGAAAETKRFVSVRSIGTGNGRGYTASWHSFDATNYIGLKVEKDGTWLAQTLGLTYPIINDHTIGITARDNGANVDLVAYVDTVSTVTYTDTTSVFTDGVPGIGCIATGIPTDSEFDDWTDNISGSASYSISGSTEYPINVAATAMTYVDNSIAAYSIIADLTLVMNVAATAMTFTPAPAGESISGDIGYPINIAATAMDYVDNPGPIHPSISGAIPYPITISGFPPVLPAGVVTMRDAILFLTGGPTVNDGLLSFYQTNGAVSNNLIDAENEFLIARGVVSSAKSDMWREFLLGLGLSGTNNDMRSEWWLLGAPLI